MSCPKTLPPPVIQMLILAGDPSFPSLCMCAQVSHDPPSHASISFTRSLFLTHSLSFSLILSLSRFLILSLSRFLILSLSRFLILSLSFSHSLSLFLLHLHLLLVCFPQ